MVGGGGGGGNEVEVKNGLESTLGGLVWVQRKNGSWWPGQIVGEEELGGEGVSDPRSGTPIKLLGRDDTSVDWFDLQTTKAVKAFRCGEYNTCIEKAQTSAANNLLKFTKYPRRENAIVCALEIEKSFLLKENPHGDARQNGEKGSSSISHSTDTSEETASEETISACEEKSNLTHELSHSSISNGETNGTTHIKSLQRGKKRRTPNDSEDDGYEGIKRMKGLNDLGMNSEKKASVLALPNMSRSPEKNVFVNNLGGVNGKAVGTLANGSSTSTMKRKRSQVVHIHELLKREYRQRPTPKVLENTTMVPVRIICDEFANPFERSDAVSSSYDFEDSNKLPDADLMSNGLLPDDEFSDMLIDVPFVDCELDSSGCRSSFPTNAYGDAFRRDLSQNIQIQASSFGHDSLNESGVAYLSASHVNQKVEKSASKWQSKGKRNVRHLSKGEEPHSRWNADVHDRLDPFIVGLENPGRFSPCSNGIVNGYTDRRNFETMSSSPRSFQYHQSRLADVSPRSSHVDSVLYEVEVTVEATRSQVQHVPYISLMSKVNGKPITGHPVVVESLEDGFCDLHSLDTEKTDTEVTVERKPCKKKKAKNRSRSHRRVSSKSKKRRGSSSKKTRKLSTISGAQKLSQVKAKPIPQTSKGPTLACIPLKVVFSRINEALNGSRSTHHTSHT
ncbi:hypothetical protein vseg_001500 [Gypsophila vaccaria]